MISRFFNSFPFPERASSFARDVDALYFFLIISTGALATVLAVLVLGFTYRYRRRSEFEIPPQIKSSRWMEYGWTGGTLVLFLVFFLWGTKVFLELQVPPHNALELSAVGKQWMWYVQHTEGQRELNELHVPVNRDVRITLASQDVIHSFFIPAFRIKQDVLPGRYTTLWFRATKPGEYHLFCAEYCGAKHSGMVGTVFAMDPAAYAEWLNTGAVEGTLASRGEKLYQQYGCSTCHELNGSGQAPNFRGLYGSVVRLEGEKTVIADDSYLRESILQSDAKIVLGYKSIMPVFQGQLSEDQVFALIAYIKALSRPAENLPETGNGQEPVSHPRSRGTSAEADSKEQQR